MNSKLLPVVIAWALLAVWSKTKEGFLKVRVNLTNVLDTTQVLSGCPGSGYQEGSSTSDDEYEFHTCTSVCAVNYTGPQEYL